MRTVGVQFSRVLIGPITFLTAAALIALGLVTLAWRDLLMQWQPFPFSAALRLPAAIVSGLLLLTGGGMLLVDRYKRIGAILASCWIGVWVLALHVPTAFLGAKPPVVALLGVAESLAVSLGLASFVRPPPKSALRAAFGLCLVVFGVSHFAYLEFTASMVPSWIPFPLAVGALTGLVHTLCGFAIVLGFRTSAAAFVEALMMASFVTLLHFPRVLADPGNRIELTMLAFATLLTASTALFGAIAQRDETPEEHVPSATQWA